MHVRIRQSCRLCGSPALTLIVDLGSQMLASTMSPLHDEGLSNSQLRKVPLELVRCDPSRCETGCGLVQLRHSYPPSLIYTNYWYESGINQTMRTALLDIATRASEYAGLRQGDIVLDIGCNDGTLLNSYLVPGLDLVGFDPATNFSNRREESFTRVIDYFSKRLFEELREKKKAKIITTIAMFYDLEDPISFAREVSEVLSDDGIWILQMADLPNMLINNMFDNICHEHLTYFHLAPMEYLLDKCGLEIIDIEKNHVNGSSYRFFIKKKNGTIQREEDAKERVRQMRISEFNLCLDTPVPYALFKENIDRNKNDLQLFLGQARERGEKILAYGASTKGNVLLQYCGFNESDIGGVADRNKRKWGWRTPGSNIPIISEEDARAMKPDYLLVLPYHFLDEMLQREDEFIRRGGRFIVPVPEIRIVP